MTGEPSVEQWFGIELDSGIQFGPASLWGLMDFVPSWHAGWDTVATGGLAASPLWRMSPGWRAWDRPLSFISTTLAWWD
jgi:hypothetical protein